MITVPPHSQIHGGLLTMDEFTYSLCNERLAPMGQAARGHIATYTDKAQTVAQQTMTHTVFIEFRVDQFVNRLLRHLFSGSVPP